MQVDNWLIPIMALLPALAACALTLPIGLWRESKNVWLFSLVTMLATFVLSLVMVFEFHWRDPDMQLGGVIPWVPAFGLSFSFGVDQLSIWFVLLTTFLMPPVVLESYHNLDQRMRGRAREFFFWLLMAETVMLGAFLAADLIFFYVCFEFTLIPLFFLIGIYGSGQRGRASTIYFLYSFAGSMLMLAGIIYVAWFNSTIDPGTLSAAARAEYPLVGQWTFDFKHLRFTGQQMSVSQQTWVLVGLLAGFGVKVPMWPVHTWLPLAHTEAPTAGSVDLAAVMLKIGTYAILRFGLQICPEGALAIAPYIGVLGIIAILYAALVCWVQSDLKKLIAYSSVSHMGFCVLALFAFDAQDIAATGSVMYMLNHGLSTGALFLCVGMVYERFHTREMDDMSGLARVLPIWSFFMVFFVMSSVGLPGLNGFVGEFLTLIGSFLGQAFNGVLFASFAAVGMIFAAIYLLYMVGRVIFGPVKVPGGEHHGPLKDLNLREIITLAPIAVVCLVLGLYPSPVLDSLEITVAQINAPAKQVLEQQQEALTRINAETVAPDGQRLVMDTD